ncbi:hypothetical protein ACFPL7_23330 [Dongia soli]
MSWVLDECRAEDRDGALHHGGKLKLSDQSWSHRVYGRCRSS